MLKIPSACNLDFGLLEWLISHYEGEVHLSFGMTTHAEEEQIVGMFQKSGRHQDLVIYACTSGYPVPFEDICLYEIKRLTEKFGGTLRGVGFSGHHLGIAADIAALALGATYFERHFTLDRTWKGTDHSASLEPDGMRRLCRDLRNVSKSLSYKNEEILPIEAVQRKKLKRKINE
jgi:N-acetylneuraminate synthase